MNTVKRRLAQKSGALIPCSFRRHGCRSLALRCATTGSGPVLVIDDNYVLVGIVTQGRLSAI